jgi:hypothetical protein
MELERCLVAKVLKIVDEVSDMKTEDGKTFFICRVPSPT